MTACHSVDPMPKPQFGISSCCPSHDGLSLGRLDAENKNGKSSLRSINSASGQCSNPARSYQFGNQLPQRQCGISSCCPSHDGLSHGQQQPPTNRPEQHAKFPPAQPLAAGPFWHVAASAHMPKTAVAARSRARPVAAPPHGAQPHGITHAQRSQARTCASASRGGRAPRVRCAPELA